MYATINYAFSHWTYTAILATEWCHSRYVDAVTWYIGLANIRCVVTHVQLIEKVDLSQIQTLAMLIKLDESCCFSEECRRVVRPVRLCPASMRSHNDQSG